jgi:HlyD family secretion protein
MKKILRIVLLVFVIAVFIGTLVFLYQKSQTKPEVFEIKQAKIDNIVKKTVATGSILPRKEIEIKPQVSGIVDYIEVEPGDIIKKGDLIAKVKIIPDMINLANAESRLEKAEIQLKDAESVFKRQKELFSKGVIAEADYLKAEISHSNAKAEVSAAENSLEIIKEGAMKKSGSAANTLIRSTIEGMVLDVPIEVGNRVIESNTFNAGSTIALVADMGEMVFEGKVDETEVGKLKNGMELVLTIGAIENITFKSVLEYVAPKGIAENGAIQFEIRASVEQKPGIFIRAGYSANADIVLETLDSVLTVEESLIIFSGDTAFVEVQKEDLTFEKRQIKTGLSDGIKIQVLEGLTTEEKLKVQK